MYKGQKVALASSPKELLGEVFAIGKHNLVEVQVRGSNYTFTYGAKVLVGWLDELKKLEEQSEG